MNWKEKIVNGLPFKPYSKAIIIGTRDFYTVKKGDIVTLRGQPITAYRNAHGVAEPATWWSVDEQGNGIYEVDMRVISND